MVERTGGRKYTNIPSGIYVYFRESVQILQRFCHLEDDVGPARILNRKCTFCKSAIADKPPALNRIARFSNVQIWCIQSVNSVSANKQKKTLTASAIFENVQLQISSRTLTASALLSGMFYLGRNL